MKGNKFLIILLIVLACAATYFYFTKSNNTLGELKDFAIEDTAKINKIFIADAKGEKVTLTRDKSFWKVDGDRKARPESIDVLMNTFYRIAIKYPVAKAAHNNVVRDMATQATKVEIYMGSEKPNKVYYIGGNTQDNLGTYMLLENNGKKSSIPFVTHIPGFSGYLTTRFFANPLQWRDAEIFKYNPNEIKKLTVTFFEKPNESFSIQNIEGKLSLLDSENKNIQNFNEDRVKQYLEMYDNVYYEMVVLDELKQEQKDSILKLNPYFKIEIQDIYGKSKNIMAFHMNNYRKTVDDQGNPFPYDIDRMYGYLNNESLIYIQFHTFDKLMLPKDTFLK
ncbi:MAG: hypothetical protein IT232_05655 [Flavobacteriales bacterium]|nr:hypothetical protein [Flavobacteriales bacterium]